MKLLLDTCTFLWFVNHDPKLSLVARRWLEDGASEVFLERGKFGGESRKYELGKLALPKPSEVFLAVLGEVNCFTFLPLADADRASGPQRLYHRDA
ncbi:MAG: hypothetical protein K2X03_06955 [Bryobacteraceae bacterium]|nr:hypothetical protein [Bryobacteraceae bacterium]